MKMLQSTLKKIFGNFNQETIEYSIAFIPKKNLKKHQGAKLKRQKKKEMITSLERI